MASKLTFTASGAPLTKINNPFPNVFNWWWFDPVLQLWFVSHAAIPPFITA